MSAGRLTVQTLFCASLAAAIAATYVAVRVLRAPEPPMPRTDMASFETAVRSAMNELVESRETSLEELEGMPIQEAQTSAPAGIGVADDRSGFDEARARMMSSLESQNIPGGAPGVAGGAPEQVIPDETLDAADQLYRERAHEHAGRAVEIYSHAMEDQARLYPGYLGYLALEGMLRRGILSYREMECLPLNEIKSTLYQAESDTMRGELEASRAAARAAVEAMSAELDVQYDQLLSALVESVIEGWQVGSPLADTGIPQWAALEQIMGVLEGLEWQPVGGVWTLDEQPAFETAGWRWIDEERGRGEQFASAGGSD